MNLIEMILNFFSWRSAVNREEALLQHQVDQCELQALYWTTRHEQAIRARKRFSDREDAKDD